MTEHELIERAARGDREAFRLLYDRHAERVLAIVRRISGDEEIARDYAQEAWLSAMRALPTFRGASSFSTWIHRIAVNAALQGARRARSRRNREVAPPDALGGSRRGMDDIAGTDRASDSLLRRRLEEGIAALPERMKVVLVLHDVEGFTHDEVGELLDISPGTSKSQLFRARLKMRVFLNGSAPSERPEGVKA